MSKSSKIVTFLKMEISAKLEVKGIGNYTDENYFETIKWLRETADFIEENRGKFDVDFTARRYFKRTDGVVGEETQYVMPDGSIRFSRDYPTTHGRDPFPPH